VVDLEEVVAAIQVAEERLEYYEALLSFLDDNLPCLDVLIEQFEEEYFKEGEDNG